jgi:hypothetical protein
MNPRSRVPRPAFLDRDYLAVHTGRSARPWRLGRGIMGALMQQLQRDVDADRHALPIRLAAASAPDDSR